MYTLIRCAGDEEKLDLDALQDELELQEFQLGLFAEH